MFIAIVAAVQKGSATLLGTTARPLPASRAPLSLLQFVPPLLKDEEKRGMYSARQEENESQGKAATGMKHIKFSYANQNSLNYLPPSSPSRRGPRVLGPSDTQAQTLCDVCSVLNSDIQIVETSIFDPYDQKIMSLK